jgi:hypothetical protein
MVREKERAEARQGLIRPVCDRCGAVNQSERPFAVRFPDGTSGKVWSRMSRRRRAELLAGGYDVLCHSCKSARKMLSDEECEQIAQAAIDRAKARGAYPW